MRKINRILNIGLIFMLIGAAEVDLVYSSPDLPGLRVPLIFDKENQEFILTQQRRSRRRIPWKDIPFNYISPRIREIREEKGEGKAKYFYALDKNNNPLGDLSVEIEEGFRMIEIINIYAKKEGRHVATSLIGYMAYPYPGWTMTATGVLTSKVMSIFESLFGDYMFYPLYNYLEAEIPNIGELLDRAKTPLTSNRIIGSIGIFSRSVKSAL